MVELGAPHIGGEADVSRAPIPRRQPALPCVRTVPPTPPACAPTASADERLALTSSLAVLLAVAPPGLLLVLPAKLLAELLPPSAWLLAIFLAVLRRQ